MAFSEDSRRGRRHVVPLAFLAVLVGASGWATGDPAPHVPARQSGLGLVGFISVGTPPFRFFSPTSIWNRTLPEKVHIDPSSPKVVRALYRVVAAEKQAKKGPNIVTTRWSVPIYTVPANQPTVRVALDKRNADHSLQDALNAVPLPADAHPAAGTDKHLAVWQPSTDRLWEFWRLEQETNGWHAGWGGAMMNVSSNPGVYGRRAWPGATPSWGASASSLSIAGGLITLEDWERGWINHALALAVPDVRAGVYSLPAHRTDGESSNPLSLPEGAHLRLSRKMNLAKLGLPRATLMIARAAKKYGIFVRSKGGLVDFYSQDPTPTGTNPYRGVTGYFEGMLPYQLLARFPWMHLQLLKMRLRPYPARL